MTNPAGGVKPPAGLEPASVGRAFHLFGRLIALALPLTVLQMAIRRIAKESMPWFVFSPTRHMYMARMLGP